MLNRRLIKEGDFEEIVTAVNVNTKPSLKHRHLFLFNDLLLITKREGTTKHNKPHYAWVDKIDLVKTKLVTNGDWDFAPEVDRNLVIQLELSSPFEDTKVERYTYHSFLASNAEDYNEWIQLVQASIKEAVQIEQQRKGNSLFFLSWMTKVLLYNKQHTMSKCLLKNIKEDLQGF